MKHFHVNRENRTSESYVLYYNEGSYFYYTYIQDHKTSHPWTLNIEKEPFHLYKYIHPWVKKDSIKLAHMLNICAFINTKRIKE